MKNKIIANLKWCSLVMMGFMASLICHSYLQASLANRDSQFSVVILNLVYIFIYTIFFFINYKNWVCPAEELSKDLKIKKYYLIFYSYTRPKRHPGTTDIFIDREIKRRLPVCFEAGHFDLEKFEAYKGEQGIEVTVTDLYELTEYEFSLIKDRMYL